MRILPWMLLLPGLAAAGGALAQVRAPGEGRGLSDARSEIAALINDWAFFRDQEWWDELLGTFHEDGTISLSWFDGPYAGFVAASQKLAASGNTILKHQLGVPRIEIRGDRALSAVDVVIRVRATTPAGEVDTTSFARFHDRLEKRAGAWKILKRTAVYEKDRADPVSGPTLPEGFFEGLDRFPATCILTPTPGRILRATR